MAVQLGALLVLLNVPDAQVAQVRSAVADGGLLTKLPALQLDHAVQAAALAVLLNVPDAHVAQVRSTVADGWLLT